MGALFPDDTGRRRRRDLILAILFSLSALVLVERAGRKRDGVLVRNQEFGARFVEGEDPYFDPQRGHRIHGPYPPSYVLICAPLSLIPTPVARRVWGTVQVAALFFLYRLLRRHTRDLWPAAEKHASMLFALALLLASRYILRDTRGGGGNLLYMSLAMAGLELSLRGRQKLAGLPLGLGLVLKPNLALLGLFFVLRGRWKTVLSTGLAALVLFWIPAFSFGFKAYGDLAQRWLGDVREYAALEDLHASALVPEGMPAAENAMNQSLREAVFRFLRPPGDSGAFDVHLIETSPQIAIWIGRVLGLSLLALLAWYTWRVRGKRAEWLAALTFLPMSLLLSPITWKAHHAALLPLFFVLLLYARDRSTRPAWLIGGLWVYYLVCDLASVEFVGDRAGDYLQALSVVTLGDIALVLGCLLLLGRGEPGPEAVPESVEMCGKLRA